MHFQRTGGDCCPDWLIECQNFSCEGSLYDAVVTSLFTEARDVSCGQGGWWCEPARGSRLHTIQTSNVSEAIALAEEYAAEALSWLQQDGVVSDLSVTAEYSGEMGINIMVSFSEPFGCNEVFGLSQGQFGWVWNG